MLATLIQKEIMLHLLSIRFVALLLMCVLLIPPELSCQLPELSQTSSWLSSSHQQRKQQRSIG